MRTYRISAPAKINLILNILQKRPDGYHDLCSLFHRVSLSDTLLICKKQKPGLKLDVSGSEVPTGKDNTIVKAYQALSRQTKMKLGLEVRLKKNIPIFSGLGGGSSDAASFLVAANCVLGLGFSQSKLMRIGGLVGSDVPFFIRDTSFALVEGKGHRVIPISCKSPNFFVIVTFKNRGLSTSKMYQSIDKKNRQPVSLTMVRANVKLCANLLNKRLLKEANKYFYNDFLPIAEKKIKRISQIIRFWRKQNIPCLMSGSGSSVFAVFQNKRVALEEVKRLKKQRDLKVYLAESYEESIHAEIKRSYSSENN